MNNEIKIVDVFNDYFRDDGLFSLMDDTDFLGLMTPKEAWIQYVTVHSRSKIISSFLDEVRENDDWKQVIASVLYNMFYQKWMRLYETTQLIYNPIENYSMTETIEVKTEHTENVDATRKYDGNTENENSTNSNVTHDTFGFNSSSGRPSDKSTDAKTGTGNVTESSTGSDKTDTDFNGTETTTHERSGNIGVTTTQQMLIEERKVLSYRYLDEIFNDIDTLLTISTY